MGKTYSTYEAKAKFSELLRRVRERGETVTVTYHGEPVAEVRPIQPPGGDGLEARLRDLEKEGVLVRAPRPVGRVRRVARRPGALNRFLADRDS